MRDEEGAVDKKLKNRIVKARDRVDEREDALFVGAPLEGAALSQQEASRIWATSVRQYLRAIEPLLRSDDVAQSEHYYTGRVIVDQDVKPPDGVYPQPGSPMEGVEPQRRYNWSLFYRDDVDLQQAIQSHDHDAFDRQFTPPEPKRITLKGLKSIIETETVSAEWAIVTNPGSIPPQQTQVFPSINAPLTREMLIESVRIADEFLQEAGIAIDVGYQEKDEEEDNPV